MKSNSFEKEMNRSNDFIDLFFHISCVFVRYGVYSIPSTLGD